WPPMLPTAFRVVEHALEIHDDRGLVADDPRIVAGGQQRDIAGLAVELGSVIHEDAKHPGDVVLEVRRLAALRHRDRLHRARPAPAGLEDRAADGGPADANQLDAALREFADLVGLAEMLELGDFALRDAGVFMGDGHWRSPCFFSAATPQFSMSDLPSRTIIAFASSLPSRTTPVQTSLPYLALWVCASKRVVSPMAAVL